MSYTVTLHHSDASAALRQDAETRYRRALDAALGGTHGVLTCWHAWQTAENLQGELPEDIWRVARRWVIAADTARRAALADLESTDATYFEVRPAEGAVHTHDRTGRAGAVAPEPHRATMACVGEDRRLIR
ncbi:Uncharacterised protein [Bordetella ansorpii]|uniref:Uncharacterized protein n=1 Tax=Bordetella ansorpii TaxID=288768 RepID=A0A157SRR8_9BORD|nr:hypothetical protein [Bordetella ansorpii]SAI73109.1 Uncharacterised protein [Bordetella ansorpii]